MTVLPAATAIAGVGYGPPADASGADTASAAATATAAPAAARILARDRTVIACRPDLMMFTGASLWPVSLASF